MKRAQDLSVSIMIPCYNEESTIAKCIASCLRQTVKAKEIIVVDDSSTDKTAAVLATFGNKIKVVKTPKNTGNKSHAQEHGLSFVKGDIIVTTDGDTLLDHKFIETIRTSFEDPKVYAAAGYVRSLKYNWLTKCRALDYSVGQNFHKVAQSYLGYMHVIPGAAGAFRADIFRDHLKFDHDTITEDLDFTYKLHKKGFKIAYNRDAIVYTQDPSTLSSYMNQMRRWYGGGWQNLQKHLDIASIHPAQALELSLTYIEGLAFSCLLFVLPLLNLRYAVFALLFFMVPAVLLSIYAAIKEKRADLLTASVPYIVLMYINSYVFLEQFVKEILMKKKNLTWYKPERVSL